MRKLLFIAALLSVSIPMFGQGFDGYSLVGTNINLSGQSPWVVYSGADEPSGCYRLSSQASPQQAIITLPATLAAGTWRIQMKADEYDRYTTATFVLAGQTNSAQLSDRDATQWFERGINFTNSYATNKLVLYLTSTNAISINLTALYWTTNLNEDVDSDGNDTIIDYTYPTTISTAVANTDNIIAGSSFETGLTGWRAVVNNKVEGITNWITYTDAAHGVAAVKMPENGAVLSPYFYVKPDSRYYTVSFYFKGPAGSFTLDTPITVPAGYSNTVDTVVSLPTVASWTRTNFTMALRDYPVGVPYRIQFYGNTGAMFDGVQVTEGTNLVTFHQMDGMELGWSNSVPSAVYYSNATDKPYVVVHNSSGSNRTVNVKWELWNHWNELETNGTFSTTLSDNSKSATAINLPYSVGWYRAVAWAGGISPQESSLVYMVSPGSSTNDFVGTHNYGRNWQVRGTERLGISWSLAMSPQSTIRWTTAEPTDDNFVWDDGVITNALANNTYTVATLGIHSGSSVPSYAGSTVAAMVASPTYMNQWSNHVYAVVNHYKAWVKNWEIWNEPLQGTITSDQYTNILYRASQAAKAADATAFVIGLGGPNSEGASYQTWSSNVLNSFGASLATYVDAISLHGYPSDTDPYSSGPAIPQAQAMHNYMYLGYAVPFGLQLYNTESGIWCFGGRMADNRYPMLGGGVWHHQHNSPFVTGYNDAPHRILQHALAWKALGATRYFYYDSRNYTDWYDNHPNTWEGDDTHRPKMAVLAVANAMISGTTGAGVITPPTPQVVFLYFENGSNSVAAAWSTNASYYTLTQTNVIPYDHMGRPLTVTANQFKVGRFPIYIKPNGLSSAQFYGALTNGGITASTDTRSPGLSIYTFPGAMINDTNRLRVRWAAVDELSLPSKNNPDDIQFHSKLSTDADYDAWGTSVERIWDNVAGNVSVTVQSKDAAGNTNTATRTFGVDTTAPNCAITSPTTVSSGGSGSYTASSSTITVSGTSDDSESAITWSNSRGGAGSATGSTSWSKSGITLQSGGNVITITATDPSGNATVTTLTVTYAAPTSGGNTNNVGTLYIR